MITYDVKTASDLKYLHESNYPDSHFFTRKTMKFFGDTMKNYRIRKHVNTFGRVYYELCRKKPVKERLQKSAYFDETGKRILTMEE